MGWEGGIKLEAGALVGWVVVVVVVDMRPAGSPGQKCKRVEGREGAGRRVSSEEVVWRADCAVLTRALGRCRVWAVECEGGTLSATGDGQG
jgi:hypothetical protein